MSQNKQKKFRVIVKPSAEKNLTRLSDKDYARVAARIVLLGFDPFVGKKLKGQYDGFYSLRVWPFRIIYCIIKNELIVIVVEVTHRKDAY